MLEEDAATLRFISMQKWRLASLSKVGALTIAAFIYFGPMSQSRESGPHIHIPIFASVGNSATLVKLNDTLGRVLNGVTFSKSKIGSTEIHLQLAPNGTLGELSVSRPSGSIEQDFNCLTAVLGCTPFDSTPELLSGITITTFADAGVGSSEIDLLGCDQRLRTLNSKTFQRFLHAETGNNFVLNAIPVDSVFRYPGVITAEDVTDEKNLRAIKKSFFGVHCTSDQLAQNKRLRAFFHEWFSFFQEHPTATKEELFAERSRLDKMFQDMFTSS